jgi:hypothetical protein
MDGGTILCHHFLNRVVSRYGLRLFVFHAEFHDEFAQVDYSVITTRVAEELFENRVVVAKFVAYDLLSQQARLDLMAKSARDAGIKGLITIRWANQILCLVL